jgi:hypothetical protein
VFSVESFGLPFIKMWVDCGKVRCCGLNKVWFGGDG